MGRSPNHGTWVTHRLCHPSTLLTIPEAAKTTTVSISSGCKPRGRSLRAVDSHHPPPCHAGASARCPAIPLLPPMVVSHSHHHLRTLRSSYLPGCFVLFCLGGFLCWVGEVVLQNSLLFHLRVLVLAWLEGLCGMSSELLAPRGGRLPPGCRLVPRGQPACRTGS